MIDTFLVIPAATGDGAGGAAMGAVPSTDEFFGKTFPDAAVVELQRFEFGVDTPVTLPTPTTAGASAGRPKFGDVVVVKAVDQTSPQLFHAMVTGGRFPVAQLYVRRPAADDPGVPFLAYEFQQVAVSGMDWDAGSGDVPAERVSLAYGALVVALRTVNAKGGAGSLTKRAWSVVTNTAKVTDTLKV